MKEMLSLISETCFFNPNFYIRNFIYFFRHFVTFCVFLVELQPFQM